MYYGLSFVSPYSTSLFRRHKDAHNCRQQGRQERKAEKMGWDHGTYGWEAYEGFTAALKANGISYRQEKLTEKLHRGRDTSSPQQRLRRAHFTTPDGKLMVVEEYLRVKDWDCDGSDRIAISVYEEGQRPKLKTKNLIP